MLLITLDSGKVYAGWVIRTPRADASNQDPGAGFGLLVYRSGYRKAETQKVVFTTDYKWLLEQTDPDTGTETLSPDTLSTFIPLHRVVVITNFDEQYYEKFQENSEQYVAEQVHGKEQKRKKQK